MPKEDREFDTGIWPPEFERILNGESASMLAQDAQLDDATSELDRLISRARNGGVRVFGVVTGYGSSGGTCRIRSAVLAACRKYLRENHIRGFVDGEHAGDIFSKQFLSFPDTGAIPVAYKRSPNPGIVFIAV